MIIIMSMVGVNAVAVLLILAITQVLRRTMNEKEASLF
jgi:hypothetical protein